MLKIMLKHVEITQKKWAREPKSKTAHSTPLKKMHVFFPHITSLCGVLFFCWQSGVDTEKRLLEKKSKVHPYSPHWENPSNAGRKNEICTLHLFFN